MIKALVDNWYNAYFFFAHARLYVGLGICDFRSSCLTTVFFYTLNLTSLSLTLSTPQLGLRSEPRVPGEVDIHTALTETQLRFQRAACNCNKHKADSLRAFLTSGQPFIATG